MRVSIQEGDRGYSPLCFGVQVWLDGERQRGVITADEDRGEVIRYRRDASGRVMLNERGDEAAIERMSGAVRIDLPQGFWR